MSGQGKSEAVPPLVIFMTIGLVIGLSWLLWRAWGAEIIETLRWIRIAEIWLVEKVTGDPQLKELRVIASRAPALNMDQVLVLSNAVMRYLRWPMAAILIIAAYFIVTKSPHFSFKKRHTLESLIKAQSQAWPIISPILKINPTHLGARVPGKPVPAVLPLFAEALSPEEWVAFNRISVINGAPERDSVRRAFLSQLGPRWNGVEALSIHARVLFAAFALKYARKRTEADELLGRISFCWSPEKGLVLSGDLAQEINKLIADPEIGGEAAKVANSHAYVATVLLGLLKKAREQGGVLASAAFLWLRGVDRNLWYPLNNLGRQAFHTEAAGAMSHFMAELNTSKPLVVPRLEAAIDALNTYFAEFKPTIPSVEGSKSEGKKK